MRMMLVAAASVAALMLSAACGGESGGLPEKGTVRGTVTYAEKIPLTSGATLEVRLGKRYWDAVHSPSITIDTKTISNLDQVPIAYKLPYTPHDNPDFYYSLRAWIFEADGRGAFYGAGSFDADSPGGVAQVDIHMELWEPPPELAAQLDGDWYTLRYEWVETPAEIIWARYDFQGAAVPQGGHRLIIAHYQPVFPNCIQTWLTSDADRRRAAETGQPIKVQIPGRLGHVELQGSELGVTVMQLEPPPLPWDNGCRDELAEVWMTATLPYGLLPGKTYTVTANGKVLSTFTFPSKPLYLFAPLESQVENVELIETEGPATRYTLRVTADMPEGGQCTEFNGYEFQQTRPGVVNVRVTHYRLALDCTQEYPVVVTDVPLDFIESREEYLVTVNGWHRHRIRGR